MKSETELDKKKLCLKISNKLSQYFVNGTTSFSCILQHFLWYDQLVHWLFIAPDIGDLYENRFFKYCNYKQGEPKNWTINLNDN